MKSAVAVKIRRHLLMLERMGHSKHTTLRNGEQGLQWTNGIWSGGQTTIHELATKETQTKNITDDEILNDLKIYVECDPIL